MSKKRGAVMIGVAAVVTAAVGLAAYFYINRDMFDAGKMMVEVYFPNTFTSELEPERRYVSKAESDAVINEVFNLMLQSPANNKHSKFALTDVSVLDKRLVTIGGRGVLELDFSNEYLDMPPADELFFRASVVWTMTGLDFITDVSIYTEGRWLAKSDGSPMGYLNRGNVLINPEISPDKAEYQSLTLYFPDSTLSFLCSEERVIQVNPDADIEKYIVEQLIVGPKQNGLVTSIPSETRLRGVKREGDTCYVSLNSDFINKHTGGTAVQNITIYSIVNSLTELHYVNKVQFLIEAEKIQDFKGGFDLSKPIERDESLIQR